MSISPHERNLRYRKFRNRLPRLITEGDSWFDYPNYPNLVDRIDQAGRYAILRFEQTGDTLVAWPQADGRLDQSTAVLGPTFPRLVQAAVAERPLAILLSAGGNDLADVVEYGAVVPGRPRREPVFLKRDATRPLLDHLNPAAWDHLERTLVAGFERVIQELGPIAPVLVHGYDYMIPSREPVRILGVGVMPTWFWKPLEVAGFEDAEEKRQLAKHAVNQLNEMLAELQRNHPEDFVHINLRGTLGPGDWENEIHPTRKGFAKLAAAYLYEMDLKLPRVLEDRARAGRPA